CSLVPSGASAGGAPAPRRPAALHIWRECLRTARPYHETDRPTRLRLTYDPEPRESPPTTPLLSVTGITKRFGGVEALNGCTLSVREGSITGLIGPNGAGKTTLFNVISGLIAADSGRIRLGDDRLDDLSAHAIARRGVARTFQIPRPLGRMTVLENVLV